MKTDSIKIGNKTGKPAVVAVVKRPETLADCGIICGGNEAAAAGLFYRGYTIWLQDRIGRPMFGDNASLADIQKAIDESQPGVTKGRGRPKAPVVVTIPKQKSFTPAEVAALLAKANVTAVAE